MQEMMYARKEETKNVTFAYILPFRANDPKAG